VQVFGAVAAAMGAPVERQTRSYMEDIFKCLSDNKPQVRSYPTALDFATAEQRTQSISNVLRWSGVL
jgi:hypothetical protein